MTVYSEMMDKVLAENRAKVDRLFKAEYIIGILEPLKAALEEIGARVNQNSWSSTDFSVYGGDMGINMKDVKILMDEYLFGNDRIEITSSTSDQQIYNTLRDKNTGGRVEFDISMIGFECKKIEVSREVVTEERITYKYECE